MPRVASGLAGPNFGMKGFCASPKAFLFLPRENVNLPKTTTKPSNKLIIMALFLYLLERAEHDSGGREHGREGGCRGNGAGARMEDGHTGDGGSRAQGKEQTHSYARSARVGASQQPALREYT
jgi:hypothetical protein